jgi:hypothetical protein
MDIDFHIGDFQLDITVAGNPFHQKNGTDIIFGKGLHAFVLNIKLFNQAITRPEIDNPLLIVSQTMQILMEEDHDLNIGGFIYSHGY